MQRRSSDAWFKEVSTESRKSMLRGGEPINGAMAHVGRWRFALKMQSDRIVNARLEPVTDFVREIDLQFFILRSVSFCAQLTLLRIGRRQALNKRLPPR